MTLASFKDEVVPGSERQDAAGSTHNILDGEGGGMSFPPQDSRGSAFCSVPAPANFEPQMLLQMRDLKFAIETSTSRRCIQDLVQILRLGKAITSSSVNW
ncbi:unnamed protein product [Peronospora belbahrii]|uniref:Uncharacterized protein n=1 Tax=Peronospora belbahrii TaxID=622444 RepID=A0AAU9KVR3_9STRA|nr:unnamed protein product [Peronospora belbahrii]CAH0518708.1 unnamed protein product [Peronospora belbahrii]